MSISARQARKARKQESQRKQEAARAFAARTGAQLVNVDAFIAKHDADMDFTRRAHEVMARATWKKEQ